MPLHRKIVYMPHQFSSVFFTANIAKRQALQWLSVHSPPITPPFLYCDVIADKAHCMRETQYHTGSGEHTH